MYRSASDAWRELTEEDGGLSNAHRFLLVVSGAVEPGHPEKLLTPSAQLTDGADTLGELSTSYLPGGAM